MSRTGSIPRESKTAARSTLVLDSSCPRCREISCESAEVWLTKSDSKSVAYEFRTKSAQSGGLETNGRGETISVLRDRVAVRRFVREARGYWASWRARSRQRIFVAEGLAEGEGFEQSVRFARTSGRNAHPKVYWSGRRAQRYRSGLAPRAKNFGPQLHRGYFVSHIVPHEESPPGESWSEWQDLNLRPQNLEHRFFHCDHDDCANRVDRVVSSAA